jgi:hypothetical protein
MHPGANVDGVSEIRNDNRAIAGPQKFLYLGCSGLVSYERD